MRYEKLKDIYDRCLDECPYCYFRDMRHYGLIASNHRRRYQCHSCKRMFCGSYGIICHRKRLDQ